MLGLVLRQGVLLTVLGLVAGSLIALAAARVVGGMLVNISPADPLTFASAAVFLELVAALASNLPARSATRVDPVVALLSEWPAALPPLSLESLRWIQADLRVTIKAEGQRAAAACCLRNACSKVS